MQIRCPAQYIEIVGESNLRLPPLPEIFRSSSVLLTKEYDILVVMNDHRPIENTCYKFVNGEWKVQNPPQNFLLVDTQGFTMQNGYYLLSPTGGNSTILPNDQNEWTLGPYYDFYFSSGDMAKLVATSNTEIVGTGGTEVPSRIFKINVITQEIKEIGNLLNGRWSHSSAFFNGKVIVTGGGGNNANPNFSTSTSTEVIDLESGLSRIVGDLNTNRRSHGMGIVTKNGKPTLIVFGGEFSKAGHEISHDSIEEWDDQTETWRISNLKLNIGRHEFKWCSLQHF